MIGHCDMATEADLIKQWMLELGNAVESVLKKQILQNITEKLDRMSAFDGLTGLYNRVGFQIQADKYKMYAKSSGRSLYISFIDIDGLKKVNDTYGHHEGDWLIKTIGECLKKASREEEVCMRFGGESLSCWDLKTLQMDGIWNLSRNFRIISGRSMRVRNGSIRFRQVLEAIR